MAGSALARSSEPAYGHHSPAMEHEDRDDSYSHREIPPLMNVPEPRLVRREQYSPPQSADEEDDPSHRSFTDSDFSALDVIPPTTPSDGPPNFRAPDPSTRPEPSYAEGQPESSDHASLSVIEDRLQEVCALIHI